MWIIVDKNSDQVFGEEFNSSDEAFEVMIRVASKMSKEEFDSHHYKIVEKKEMRMGNITYIKDWLDKRPAKRDTNEVVEADETEGVKIIRKNMKEYGKRMGRVNKIREANNKAANPKG